MMITKNESNLLGLVLEEMKSMRARVCERLNAPPVCRRAPSKTRDMNKNTQARALALTLYIN